MKFKTSSSTTDSLIDNGAKYVKGVLGVPYISLHLGNVVL
jgi:hypothetical protein